MRSRWLRERDRGIFGASQRRFQERLSGRGRDSAFLRKYFWIFLLRLCGSGERLSQHADLVDFKLLSARQQVGGPLAASPGTAPLVVERFAQDAETASVLEIWTRCKQQ